MTYRTPQQFGALLGLELGLDGRRGDTLDFGALESLGLEQGADLLSDQESMSWDYWAFGQMYLPSFIKTVFHYPLSQSMGYRLVCHQHSFFLSVARSPAFARYARTYPNSARRCLSSLLDRFGSFDPAVLQTCPPYQRSDLLRGFILCFHEFLQVLLWDTDDNGFHLSPLEPGTVDGLRRLLPIIASDTTREDGGRAFPVYLARIESGQAFTRQNSPDMNQGGRYRAYRNCEALRPGLSGTISPCVDNGALHYCSRCHSVVYCGKAHQKLDWNRRHKHVCVEPAW